MKGRSLLLVSALVLSVSLGGVSASQARDVHRADDATTTWGTEAGGGFANAEAPEQVQRPRRFEPCVRGMAGEFPCHRVDMLYHFPMEEIG